MHFKSVISKNVTFIKYVIIGAATTLINIIGFFILNPSGMNYLLANTLAWLASVIFAFFTNKQIVFQSVYTTKKAFFRELISFFVLRAVSLILDDGLMFVLISVFSSASWLAKIVTQVIVVISNYIFSKLIFVDKKD